MPRRATQAEPSEPTDHEFYAALLAEADLAERKTERTRTRLLASMAQQITAGADRRDLKVANVTGEAGLAHGTFYRYFPDMRAATDALIEEFAQFVRRKLSSARAGEPGTPERVRAATLVYTLLFKENAPLMRCLIDLGSEDTEFALSYQKLNRTWYERMAAAIAKHQRGSAAAEPETVLPVAYALGGMIDDFLAQAYLRKEPALAELAEDPAAVTELLTNLWLKGAYGMLPG